MSLIYNRKISRVSEGLMNVQSSARNQKVLQVGDIVGEFWKLIFIKINSGQIYWETENGFFFPHKKQFAIYIPPNSICMDYFDNTDVSFYGFDSSLPSPVKNCSFPFIYYPDFNNIPKNYNKIKKHLKEIDLKTVSNVSRNMNPSGIAIKIKNMIEKNYRNNIQLSDVANKLKISNASLTKHFKSSYGMTPAKFRKGLRIYYAHFHLAMGVPPKEVAYNAGYNDLGRFYKQFKEYLRNTPSIYSIKS